MIFGDLGRNYDEATDRPSEPRAQFKRVAVVRDHRVCLVGRNKPSLAT